MEANAGMVAGSYKKNELVRIRHDSDSGVSLFRISIFYCFALFWVTVLEFLALDLSGDNLVLSSRFMN